MADLTGMMQAAAGVGGGGIPWDISTAVYNGTPFGRFGVQAQDGTPQGIAFKSDGTKMYMLGAVNDAVFEYNLSSAWDINTASYLQSFSIAAQDGTPQDIFFKPDGTKMYMVGGANDAVFEYNLSSAWDISTASYLQTFSILAQESSPSGLFFKPDGTKMYVLGFSGDDVNEYDLSSAWDISTASYLQNFSVAGQDIVPEGLFFKPDGTKMYVIGDVGDDVNEYDLSSAWDISTASYLQNFSIAGQGGSPKGLFFKSDGTKMYFIDAGNDAVHQYSLSSAWDVSTASYDFPPTTNYFSVAAQDLAPGGVFFKPDGTKMYFNGLFNDKIYEYDLSSAWDISTASYVQDFSVAAQDLNPNGMFFKSDGTKMYVAGSSGQDVNEYDLSSAWNISTASYLQNFSVAGQDSSPTGVFFKPDGTKMYIAGASNDKIYEYNLSSAWNISTASYLQDFFVGSQVVIPQDVFFKDDGTKMYVPDSNLDNIVEYDLSSAWNISTASYLQTLYVGSRIASPTGVFFKSDGTVMYIADDTLDAILSYDL